MREAEATSRRRKPRWCSSDTKGVDRPCALIGGGRWARLAAFGRRGCRYPRWVNGTDPRQHQRRRRRYVDAAITVPGPGPTGCADRDASRCGRRVTASRRANRPRTLVPRGAIIGKQVGPSTAAFRGARATARAGLAEAVRPHQRPNCWELWVRYARPTARSHVAASPIREHASAVPPAFRQARFVLAGGIDPADVEDRLREARRARR